MTEMRLAALSQSQSQSQSHWQWQWQWQRSPRRELNIQSESHGALHNRIGVFHWACQLMRSILSDITQCLVQGLHQIDSIHIYNSIWSTYNCFAQRSIDKWERYAIISITIVDRNVIFHDWSGCALYLVFISIRLVLRSFSQFFCFFYSLLPLSLSALGSCDTFPARCDRPSEIFPLPQ